MAENNLTANELYFRQAENEQGINLTLEENLQNNLAGLINDRFISAENARDLDEQRCLRPIIIIVVCMVKILGFVSQKNLEFL